MRSNKDFIEVHSGSGKRFLINKAAIIYIMPSDTEDDRSAHAVIKIKDGDRTYKIVTRESYDEIVHELLWVKEEK